MDAGAALRDALDRAGRQQLLVLLAAFIVLAVGSVLARQSLLAASLDQYLASGGDPTALPVPPAEFQPVPLSLGLRYSASLVVFGVIAVLHEYLVIVASRSLAAGDSLRRAATHRPVRGIVSGIAVGLVVKTLVILGLVALVFPGLYLAAALLYAHVRVAVEDESAIAALRGSWSLTAGRRRTVAAVLLYLAALYVTPRLLASFVPGAPGYLLGGVLVAFATIPAVGVVAGSYVRLRDREPEEDDDEPDEDQYSKPLGPDDLPEPE